MFNSTHYFHVTHNGFHGFTRVTIRFTCDSIVTRGEHKDLYLRVSPAVAKRINKAVCPYAECKCGESLARQYDSYTDANGRLHTGTNEWLVFGDDEPKGNYPQS